MTLLDHPSQIIGELTNNFTLDFTDHIIFIVQVIENESKLMNESILLFVQFSHTITHFVNFVLMTTSPSTEIQLAQGGVVGCYGDRFTFHFFDLTNEKTRVVEITVAHSFYILHRGEGVLGQVGVRGCSAGQSTFFTFTSPT